MTDFKPMSLTFANSRFGKTLFIVRNLPVAATHDPRSERLLSAHFFQPRISGHCSDCQAPKGAAQTSCGS
ncbi:hypothetical protein [Brevirhabdus pacifica]|uniref:hypothetical protein n=1 Tax=Brevirhabdus pacifica TaxID=1267768 RepID=UPI001180D5EA|nr:hypothetical protein [Brevirhabdus pacifica]